MCPYDDEPPQEWYECEACGGEGQGVIGRTGSIVISAAIDPPEDIWGTCSRCNGAGGWLDDARPNDDEGQYCPYRHFTEEEEAAWARVFEGGAVQMSDHSIKLLREMMDQEPWCDQPWARMALAIGIRTIQRGRHLTEAEKMENLAKAMEEDGEEGIAAAAKIRSLVTERE